MKRLLLCILVLVLKTSAFAQAAPQTLAAAEPLKVETQAPSKNSVKLRLYNSGYAYNGENDAWAETRVTLTYFENLFEPTLLVDINPEIAFKVGAGLLIPFDQEQKVSR
ncbi:MAG: hypothetical protein KDD51_07865, partial [Bdellovibrionales bacterium]|nr:hypothetical protein [Bdellovibrionales bacterium]